MNIRENKKERLEFIDKWAEYMKGVSDKVWSKQQKVLIDSQIQNARYWRKCQQ